MYLAFHQVVTSLLSAAKPLSQISFTSCKNLHPTNMRSNPDPSPNISRKPSGNFGMRALVVPQSSTEPKLNIVVPQTL